MTQNFVSQCELEAMYDAWDFEEAYKAFAEFHTSDVDSNVNFDQPKKMNESPDSDTVPGLDEFESATLEPLVVEPYAPVVIEDFQIPAVVLQSSGKRQIAVADKEDDWKKRLFEITIPYRPSLRSNLLLRKRQINETTRFLRTRSRQTECYPTASSILVFATIHFQ